MQNKQFLGEEMICRDQFDIVLKLTERCNLACKYCYYFSQDYDATKQPAFIQPKVVEELPHFINRSVDALQLKRLNISLHGGEPLLLGKKKFDHLCNELRQLITPKVKCSISIQTNAVLIDDEWIEIFSRHNIYVGVSIDGDQRTHDTNRIYKNGSGSYKNVVKGIQLLQTAVEAKRLPGVGAICVWNADATSKAQLEHVLEDLDISNVSLNYPRGGKKSESVQAWNEGIEGHLRLTRAYLDRYTFPKFKYVQGLSEILLGMTSERAMQARAYAHAQQNCIATIASSGELLMDDNVISIDPSLSTGSLTIFGTSLRDLMQSDMWSASQKALDTIPMDCQGCDWKKICRGGKLYHRYSDEQGFEAKSAICESLKKIYEEVYFHLIDVGAASHKILMNRLEIASTPQRSN